MVDHPPVEGLRVAMVETSSGPGVVGLTADAAAILGGKIANPCTDLGLGFGPLAEGATTELRATAWFVKGGLEELTEKMDAAR